ncbi:hypothetical protein GLOTRDRAFT_140531 [Gloeophyllum trabeum ATCC 11539]|uniref:Uncharacterized protein n=1 Tax=Gloeophyllum trabeum (strain ATCC 11539 / FP-39264 / Madison 617) TaxID=670483 RepID=S7PWU4_GLOTA|nr:uncharacterized protein GLOTRDRAFT_140531 [Gloeophyllum trabeum ATCC 11539]EPQ52086.1 hypothetical protein GLOTRDRAFT_140531 [Gloeophyllum trabeum ATCC 11539]
MVDWQSPAEIAKDSEAFARFMHALIGLYMWEFVTSLPFDWEFISGRKKFRWPMVFYFANRYFLLIALVGILVVLNVTRPLNCQALYTFVQCFGNASIGLASINLSIRTMAVWSQKWYIVAPLVCIILGHWSMLLHGILLTAAYIPGQGCAITNTNSKLLAATFIYSMCFDFLVLTLTAWKLAYPWKGRSALFKMIFGDGLVYFAVAFLANLIATIFMLLDLNPVMSIIANVPAAIASSIVACRVVRRLTKFTTRGPELFSSTGQGSTLAFRGTRPPPTTMSFKKPIGTESMGVHVQMETFTAQDPKDESFMEYDAAGKVVKEGQYDPEAQAISDEFKRPPY